MQMEGQLWCFLRERIMLKGRSQMLHQSLLNVDNDDQEKKTNATIIICVFGQSQGQGPVHPYWTW